MNNDEKGKSRSPLCIQGGILGRSSQSLGSQPCDGLTAVSSDGCPLKVCSRAELFYKSGVSL